ncbi:ATP-dependent nuclease [Lactococcus lactis]|uniref:AAA family ATPase n=1 Tax=Lactococcus lactis TaxID=1358 RepID=A0AAP3Z0I6_9LACT|nr:AAA family ATPase [Lactococcus lactis]MDG4976132.1 AAA family ATPase [Lactococcus lactis]
MFISNLKITNFRNYRFSSFHFEKGTNTIIGENDAGKSNAMIAIRMLLDDRYYYTQKSLKESDFNKSLGDWRGHWIVISIDFDGMTSEEATKEIISQIMLDIDTDESLEQLNFNLSNTSTNTGNISLIIRPIESVRKELFDASDDTEKFQTVRKTISLADYEFLFLSKGSIDFSDEQNYKSIVGDLDSCSAPDPNECQNNESVIGTKININDIANYISVVFIDALRDVLLMMTKGNNPIRNIVRSIENNIDEDNIQKVREKIKNLNLSIAEIAELKGVQGNLNSKLVEILGFIYSPDLLLTSNISDELVSLSKFLNLNPEDEEGMNSLGLGHLNMIFIALKIVEYNFTSTREILNIMLIEEPEAHIHHHIQKTLFRNLGIKDKTTQVIMTTHSPNIAEASEISRMNIVKNHESKSKAMQPFKGLNKFGKDNLGIKLNLTHSIERYLDSKRSALLFSKGIILVEGDAEEIIIPSLIKKVLKISLDEIGVSVINIGSTSFQYIAPLFSDERIQRYCAIVTDLDVQAVPSDSKLFKSEAGTKGVERKKKLESMFNSNDWVEPYFANTTFEIEMSNTGRNIGLYKNAVSHLYVNNAAIRGWQEKLSSDCDETRNESVLKLAENFGKGWLAVTVSVLISEADFELSIPEYILEALVFASQESITEKFLEKLINRISDENCTVEEFMKPERNNESHYVSLFTFIKKWKSL